MWGCGLTFAHSTATTSFKYDLFWEAGEKYLVELETLASGNRHGRERSLQQPLSVPDFTRQVERRLCEAGKTDAPIPSPDWVAFQFHPRRATSGVARRYTGRWAIKMQVGPTVSTCTVAVEL
jgi:hypothetical protein